MSERGEPYPMKNIQCPGKHDLLLGRGGETNNHSGNICFRRLVAGYRDKYKEASRADKPKVAAELVAHWRSLSPTGRFLARTIPGRIDSDWYDIGDPAAKKRTSKSLGEREIKPRGGSASPPSSGKKRAMDSDSSTVHLGERRTQFTPHQSASASASAPAPAPFNPLVGDIGFILPGQANYVDTSYRRHSLEPAEALTASLSLRQEEQKSYDGYGAMMLDPNNLPTAAALTSTVFGFTSSNEEGGNEESDTSS